MLFMCEIDCVLYFDIVVVFVLDFCKCFFCLLKGEVWLFCEEILLVELFMNGGKVVFIDFG